MGVQARPFSMAEDNAAKSPSMESVTSPVGRKRRYMDVVLVSNEDDAEEDAAELTQRVSFKRSKSGDSELRIDVRDSLSSEPATPKSTKSSPSVKNAARPNMSASQTITLDMLRPHFEKPLAQVAQVFGICVTLLKKICRKNGLARWPHRQIIGLRKSIASMEQAISHFEGVRRDSYAQQLEKQRNKLTALLEDPTKCNLLAVDDEYLPSQPRVEEYAHHPTEASTHRPVPYYTSSHDSYAPAPAYEHHYQPYASHTSYYHHAPPPVATHHVASYPAQHFYPTPYTQALAPPPPPSSTIPPLRTDSRPALPSLAALMGRRW